MAGGAGMLVDVILQCVSGRQADEGLMEDVGQLYLVARCKAVVWGDDQHQMVFCQRMQLQILCMDSIGDESRLGLPRGNEAHDFSTGAFMQPDMQVWPFGQPGREPGWQEGCHCGGVGIQLQCAPGAQGKVPELAFEHLLLTQDQTCMVSQRFACFGSDDAPGLALHQGHACIRFDIAQAFAGRSQRQIGACGALGNAASVHNTEKQPEVGKIWPHSITLFLTLRADRRLGRKNPIVLGQADGFNTAMHESFLYFSLVLSIFLGAGLVKGVTGMGLPTVAMGLLGSFMAPAMAAATLVIPSLVTNVWQMFSGSFMSGLLRRLWSMMLGIVLGTVGGTALLARVDPLWSGFALGLALVLYAGYALVSPTLAVSPRIEPWLSPVVGLLTGIITGATGVFVMPAVPYLQALRLDRDELVQALGLSFTISTLALAGGLFVHGVFHLDQVGLSLLAVIPSVVGMWLGQQIRMRISPQRFRQCFLLLLMVLGTELSLRPFF